MTTLATLPLAERLQLKFPGCPLPPANMTRWPKDTGAALTHRFDRGPRRVGKITTWCWLLRWTKTKRPAVALWAPSWLVAYQQAMKVLQAPVAMRMQAAVPEEAAFNAKHAATWRWSDLVREYLQWKEQTKAAGANTLNEYESLITKHLTPYLGGVLKDPLLAQVRPSDVGACLDHAERTSKLSARSYNKLRTLLSMMYAYASAKDDTGAVSNPVRPAIHFRKEPDRDVIRLSEAQLQRLLAAFKDSGNPNYYPAIFLAGRAGLRLEEVAHVEGRDLEFTPAFDVVHVVSGRACSCLDCLSKITRKGQERPAKAVRKTKTTAGKRYVPLSPDLVQALKAHQARLTAAGLDPMGRLFVTFSKKGHGSQRQSGDAAPADDLSYAVRTVEERLGIAAALALASPETKRKPFHELRATARSRWSERSGNTEQIAFAMGHQLGGIAADYTVADRQRCYEALEGAKVAQDQVGKRRLLKVG